MVVLPLCLLLVAQVGAINLHLPPKVSAKVASGSALNVISGDTSKEIDQNSCAELSAKDAKFKISLCKGSGLQGAFKIQKTQGCDGANVEISKDAKTDADARMLGEDEFSLELEGPEVRVLRHTSSKEEVAKCMYNVPFQISVPGKYHVNLAFHRESFASVKETGEKRWPELALDKPLGEKTFFEIGPDETDNFLSKALNQEGLPKCDLHKQNKGRWVFKENADSIFTNPPAGRCFTNDPAADKKFGRKTQPCPAKDTLKPVVDYSKFTWRSDQCQQKQYTSGEAATCMKKKSLEIRGDSNMRKLYFAFMHYACGVNANYTIHEMDIVGTCKKYPTCGQLCFNGDVHGIQGPGPLRADLTVSNFGQWPAAGGYRTTVAGYRSKVDAYAKKLEGNPRKANFAWMETNYLPLRNDEYVHMKRDFRTAHRLKLYNDYANEKFISMGIPIVQSYERVAAFSQHTDDIAHYPAEVNQPMVNDILNLICEE